MAGGSGRRMGSGEKPIVRINGKPMVDYVVEALCESTRIDRIHIVVSPKVPATEAYLREKYADDYRISIIVTPGTGYIVDTVYAVNAIALHEPFLILGADLPLISARLIDFIIDTYAHCGREALTVRVPSSIATKANLTYRDNGRDTVPAGINVLNGAAMDREQDEYVLVIDDAALAMNVNYAADLETCKLLISKKDGKI